MKVRIAMFKSEYGTEVCFINHYPTDKEAYESYITSGYTPLTEFINIEFPELPQEQCLRYELQTINSVIEKKNEEFLAIMEPLRTRRANLLALTVCNTCETLENENE